MKILINVHETGGRREKLLQFLKPKTFSNLNKNIWIKNIMRPIFRSSRPQVFCKNGVVRNFAKFTGKHLCQSRFFNKVAGLRPATLLKKWLWHRCFPVNFVKFIRTPFIIEHLCWLHLNFHIKICRGKNV